MGAKGFEVARGVDSLGMVEYGLHVMFVLT